MGIEDGLPLEDIEKENNKGAEQGQEKENDNSEVKLEELIPLTREYQEMMPRLQKLSKEALFPRINLFKETGEIDDITGDVKGELKSVYTSIDQQYFKVPKEEIKWEAAENSKEGVFISKLAELIRYIEGPAFDKIRLESEEKAVDAILDSDWAHIVMNNKKDGASEEEIKARIQEVVQPYSRLAIQYDVNFEDESQVA